jgi:hypothetical protein
MPDIYSFLHQIKKPFLSGDPSDEKLIELTGFLNKIKDYWTNKNIPIRLYDHERIILEEDLSFMFEQLVQIGNASSKENKEICSKRIGEFLRELESGNTSISLKEIKDKKEKHHKWISLFPKTAALLSTSAPVDNINSKVLWQVCLLKVLALLTGEELVFHSPSDLSDLNNKQIHFLDFTNEELIYVKRVIEDLSYSHSEFNFIRISIMRISVCQILQNIMKSKCTIFYFTRE